MTYSLERGEGYILARLGRPHAALSTLPNPPVVDAVLFTTVKSWVEDFVEYAEELRASFGRRTAVFLTAADVGKAFGEEREGPVAVLGTVAMQPASCVGTINLAVLAEASLSPFGLADLMRTAVEAKAMAAADGLARCGGRRAPGTVTDAVLAARPADLEGVQHFAGPATEVGRAAASAVYRLVRRMDRWDLLHRALGVPREELRRMLEALLAEAPIPGATAEEGMALLEEALADPNVWAVVLAAAELDALGAAGAIPGLAAEEYGADSVRIVADELLGVALADYLEGFNGVLTLYWVERAKKRGLFREAAVFADDVASALLAAVYLRLYRRRR